MLVSSPPPQLNPSQTRTQPTTTTPGTLSIPTLDPTSPYPPSLLSPTYPPTPSARSFSFSTTSSSGTTATSTASTTTSQALPTHSTILPPRQFPSVVFLIQQKITPAPPATRATTTTLGVYMSRTNSNQECRRLYTSRVQATETKQRSSKTKVKKWIADMEPTPEAEAARVARDLAGDLERWEHQSGEGGARVECWVEVHDLVPKTWVGSGSAIGAATGTGTGSAGSGGKTMGKLYENEEADDEIVEADEEDAGGL